MFFVLYSLEIRLSFLIKMFEGLLTVEECREALKYGMDTGKSPGIDGLTAEFYIAFCAVLGSFVFCFARGLDLWCSREIYVFQLESEIVCIFEKGSGSKLNLDKTEGMWFGSMAGRTDGPVNIKWKTDFIKVLGIFRRDIQKCCMSNM